jgi:hypothetical protein
VVYFSKIRLIFTEVEGLLVADMGQNGQNMGQNCQRPVKMSPKPISDYVTLAETALRLQGWLG